MGKVHSTVVHAPPPTPPLPRQQGPIKDTSQRELLLRMYTSGILYDCTFLVFNNAKSESKIFRCHKMMLASYSEVFEKLFSGSFKEAVADRDYEIELSKTSPDVFELAMRFVYGGVKDFETPQMAVQVYLFAQEWMIEHLKKAVENFLATSCTICTEDVLKILELFIDDKDSIISRMCLKTIEKYSNQILSDKSWLEAPEEVVLMVLQMDSMQMSETSLFWSLYTWGRAQVDDEADVRAKIEKGLKLIRFGTVGYFDFNNLCSKPNPLTGDEKFKILSSITQKSVRVLPEGFSKSLRSRRCIVWGHHYNWVDSLNSFNCTVDCHVPEPVILTFSVKTSCYLTGIVLLSMSNNNNVGKQVDVTCQVFSSEQPYLPITSVSFCDTVPANCSGFLNFPWPVRMRAGIPFTIKVFYNKLSTELLTAAFVNGKSFTWNGNSSDPDGQVTVEFADCVNCIVDISGLFLAKMTTKRILW